MTLKELVKGLEGVKDLRRVEVIRGGSVSVTGLAADSRKIRQGDLFAALSGSQDDGSKYARQAIEAGAACVMGEKDPGKEFPAYIRAVNPRAALSEMASHFFGDPSSRMTLIGITGTNGKTTTAYLLASVLSAWGQPAGVIGTLGGHFEKIHRDFMNTTPPDWEVQEVLSEMSDQGAQAVAIEISSHALAQQRSGRLKIAGGVFTNLTRDHLDYHGSLAEYRKAKSLLFSQVVDAHGFAVANLDDPEAPAVLEDARCKVWWYGTSEKSDFQMTDVESGPEGISFRQNDFLFESPLVGKFNLWNLGAAVAVGRILKIPAEDIAAGLKNLKSVMGRMQRVDVGQNFVFLVDYAHTPDALDHVLQAARGLTSGRVLVAFGCGGDRDAGKRPAMGRIAKEKADWIVLTSDNPRSEEPDQILQDILRGVGATEKKVVLCPDRREAIRQMIGEARPGDVAVLAGKGHEIYQIVGSQRLDFDDVSIARKELKEMLGAA